MNFTSNRCMEILVRYFSIAIIIKFFEYCLKLCIIQFDTPMLKVKSKLFRVDSSSFFFIQITKCLPNCFPLQFNFLNNGLFELFQFIYFIEVYFLEFSLFICMFKLWIFNRVMTKVEAFALVNGISDPFTEVSIAELTLASGIFFNKKLL